HTTASRPSTLTEPPLESFHPHSTTARVSSAASSEETNRTVFCLPHPRVHDVGVVVGGATVGPNHPHHLLSRSRLPGYGRFLVVEAHH
ncbi:hypothetical protein A2U01_0039857, partial [Trifolium medium]|nr:hypothetical protein [Trifolium medium]